MKTCINVLFEVLQLAIFVDVILSWIPFEKENEFVRIIKSITAPLLIPGRKLQERFSPQLPFDFSPIVALLLLNIISSLVNSFL